MKQYENSKVENYYNQNEISIHLVPTSWFLISFSKKTEQGLFWEMADSRTGARHVQDENLVMPKRKLLKGQNTAGWQSAERKKTFNQGSH